MAPKVKARTDVALRDALADVLRDELIVAERFERLGLEKATAPTRGKLDAIAAGMAVTVRSDTLGAALEAAGAPIAVQRDVLNGRADYYAVEPDGDWNPAS